MLHKPDVSSSVLLKSAQGYGLASYTQGPTLGSLEDAIMHDVSIGVMQRQQALQMLAQATAGMPDSTPISRVVGSLGGGLLGFLISKYFKMGGLGQVLATVAGFGIGRVMTQAARRDPWSNVG